MEVSKQIEIFYDFLEAEYHAELLDIVRRGEKFLIIDFIKLSRHSPELADILLDDPENIVKAAEKSLEKFDFKDIKDFRIRFINLPSTQHITIRSIRNVHTGKLIYIEGLIRQKSDVRPQVTLAKFECPSCGNIISVYQVDMSFKEPAKCGCGRKGKFRLISKDMVDTQRIVLEEAPDQLEGGEQAKRIDVFLRADLVSPMSEKRTNPGSKIGVVGVVNEVPIILKTGIKSVRFDLIVEANSVSSKEESYMDVKIDSATEAEIKKLSEDPEIYAKMIDSIAPSIYGHDKVKEALILQMFGGVRKKRPDGTAIRGDIHVLLVGDPGSGKSQLLKRVAVVAPKSRYVSGQGASAAGLTASVVRDEFLKGWALEAGALPLTNMGICMIDELDKMSKEDRSAMHEALEQQSISIAKANIQATLRAETTVLAAANPKYGRFDPYDPIPKQIDLPPALISRFDLIFPIKDIPDRDSDARLAKFILNLHVDMQGAKGSLDTKLLSKYISYAKQNIRPEMSESAVEEILNYFVDMRGRGSVEGDIRTIPITARQLEALVRLAEASAKVRLSEKVLRKDARRAIDLVHYCLELVGMDKKTGKFDIDRISTGVPASQRSKLVTIRELISELENKIGKTIPIADVVAAAKERGISDDEIDEVIEKFKRQGDIFEPKKGFIQKIT